MKSFRMMMILIALSSTQVLAEPPMTVDDAGTLGQGGMKLEGAVGRDHKLRAADLVFGFAPIENLEVGLALTRGSDSEPDPASRLRAAGLGIKWVPLQNEVGLSLGLSLAYGRERIDDRAADERFSAREHLASGLATYRFASGQVVHANLGGKRVESAGESATLATWGLGFEQPLSATLKLTAEVFGEEGAGPDKALGLRYTVFEGLKLSAALGRGNGRNFGQLGFSWEF